MRTLILLLATNLTFLYSFCQTTSEVEIPTFNDTYSGYVKNLESGKTDIDYQDFRFSFIESEQFKIASQQSPVFDSLKKVMYSKIETSEFEEVIKITKQMLSIDYTSMKAHKILRQTYKIVGDTVNAAKYKVIQFGLLNSIVQNGNGQTCETAWPVIQISEEYFILEMIGAELKSQSIDNNGGLCDKMSVKVGSKKKTYFFETSKVFQGYKKLGYN